MVCIQLGKQLTKWCLKGSDVTLLTLLAKTWNGFLPFPSCLPQALLLIHGVIL